MPTRTGTSHFISTHAAQMYYGGTMDDIREKVRAGEISIGEPKPHPGTKLGLDEQGRYFYEDVPQMLGELLTPTKQREELILRKKLEPAVSEIFNNFDSLTRNNAIDLIIKALKE